MVDEVIYNNRKYKLRTGVRGGHYILVKGEKKYVNIKSAKKTTKPKKTTTSKKTTKPKKKISKIQKGGTVEPSMDEFYVLLTIIDTYLSNPNEEINRHQLCAIFWLILSNTNILELLQSYITNERANNFYRSINVNIPLSVAVVLITIGCDPNTYDIESENIQINSKRGPTMFNVKVVKMYILHRFAAQENQLADTDTEKQKAFFSLFVDEVITGPRKGGLDPNTKALLLREFRGIDVQLMNPNNSHSIYSALSNILLTIQTSYNRKVDDRYDPMRIMRNAPLVGNKQYTYEIEKLFAVIIPKVEDVIKRNNTQRPERDSSTSGQCSDIIDAIHKTVFTRRIQARFSKDLGLGLPVNSEGYDLSLFKNAQFIGPTYGMATGRIGCVYIIEDVGDARLQSADNVEQALNSQLHAFATGILPSMISFMEGKDVWKPEIVPRNLFPDDRNFELFCFAGLLRSGVNTLLNPVENPEHMKIIHFGFCQWIFNNVIKFFATGMKKAKFKTFSKYPITDVTPTYQIQDSILHAKQKLLELPPERQYPSGKSPLDKFFSF